MKLPPFFRGIFKNANVVPAQPTMLTELLEHGDAALIAIDAQLAFYEQYLDKLKKDKERALYMYSLLQEKQQRDAIKPAVLTVVK